MVLKLVELL